MFEGRKFKQVGFGARTIRFADADCGVATTTYSYKLTEDQRAAMARRITAALNHTRNMSVEQLEAGSAGVDQSAKIAALQARVNELEERLARVTETTD